MFMLSTLSRFRNARRHSPTARKAAIQVRHAFLQKRALNADRPPALRRPHNRIVPRINMAPATAAEHLLGAYLES